MKLHTPFLALVLLSTLAPATGCTSVDEGERGIKLIYGKIDEVIEPGRVSTWGMGVEVGNQAEAARRGQVGGQPLQRQRVERRSR